MIVVDVERKVGRYIQYYWSPRTRGGDGEAIGVVRQQGGGCIIAKWHFRISREPWQRLCSGGNMRNGSTDWPNSPDHADEGVVPFSSFMEVFIDLSTSDHCSIGV